MLPAAMRARSGPTPCCALTRRKRAPSPCWRPENLTGISATLEGETLTLSYDDISLDAGSYSAASISPVAALPKLMAAAASGYLTEQSEETLGERPCLRLAFDLEGDEGTLYTTWFDQETLLPLRSEISADGVVVFDVAWSRFEITENAPAESSETEEQAAETTAAQTAEEQTAETAAQQTTEEQPSED